MRLIMYLGLGLLYLLVLGVVGCLVGKFIRNGSKGGLR